MAILGAVRPQYSTSGPSAFLTFMSTTGTDEPASSSGADASNMCGETARSATSVIVRSLPGSVTPLGSTGQSKVRGLPSLPLYRNRTATFRGHALGGVEEVVEERLLVLPGDGLEHQPHRGGFLGLAAEPPPGLEPGGLVVDVVLEEVHRPDRPRRRGQDAELDGRHPLLVVGHVVVMPGGAGKNALTATLIAESESLRTWYSPSGQAKTPWRNGKTWPLSTFVPCFSSIWISSTRMRSTPCLVMATGTSAFGSSTIANIPSSPRRVSRATRRAPRAGRRG